MSLGQNPTESDLWLESEEVLKNGGTYSTCRVGSHYHHKVTSADDKIVLSWDEYPGSNKIQNIYYNKEE